MDKIFRQLLGISWLLISLYIGITLIEYLRDLYPVLSEMLYPVFLLIWVGAIFFGSYLISKIYSYLYTLNSSEKIKPNPQKYKDSSTTVEAPLKLNILKVAAGGFIIAVVPPVIASVDIAEEGRGLVDAGTIANFIVNKKPLYKANTNSLNTYVQVEYKSVIPKLSSHVPKLTSQ